MLASIASVLLGAATMVCWARGFGHEDRARVFMPGKCSVTSRQGGVQIKVVRRALAIFDRFDVGWSSDSTEPRGFTWIDLRDVCDDTCGWENSFVFRRSTAYLGTRKVDGAGGYTAVFVMLPHWAFLGMAAVLPALVVGGRVKARHRRTNGACRRCGYDLRESPDGCPECGSGRVVIPHVLIVCCIHKLCTARH